MNRIKKIVMGIAALAALALGGATIAGATGNDDGADHALSGPKADSTGKAALSATGGGTVRSVEADDEGDQAGYEVKVDKAGTVYEVKVSDDGHVTGQQLDDDQDRGDGDGETNDD